MYHHASGKRTARVLPQSNTTIHCGSHFAYTVLPGDLHAGSLALDSTDCVGSNGGGRAGYASARVRASRERAATRSSVLLRQMAFKLMAFAWRRAIRSAQDNAAKRRCVVNEHSTPLSTAHGNRGSSVVEKNKSEETTLAIPQSILDAAAKAESSTGRTPVAELEETRKRLLRVAATWRTAGDRDDVGETDVNLREQCSISREHRVYVPERNRVLDALVHGREQNGEHKLACAREDSEVYTWGDDEHAFCLVEYVLVDGSTGVQRGVTVESATLETFSEFILGGDYTVNALTFHWFFRKSVDHQMLAQAVHLIFQQYHGTHRSGHKTLSDAPHVGQKRTRVDAGTTEGTHERGVYRWTSDDDALLSEVVHAGELGQFLVDDFAEALHRTAVMFGIDAVRDLHQCGGQLDSFGRFHRTRGWRWQFAVHNWLSMNAALGRRTGPVLPEQSYFGWFAASVESDTGDGREPQLPHHYYTSPPHVVEYLMATTLERDRQFNATVWYRPPRVCFIHTGMMEPDMRLDASIASLCGIDGYTSIFERLYPTLFGRGAEFVFASTESLDKVSGGDSDVKSASHAANGLLGRSVITRQLHMTFLVDEQFFHSSGVDVEHVPEHFFAHAPRFTLATIHEQTGYSPLVLYALYHACYIDPVVDLSSEQRQARTQLCAAVERDFAQVYLAFGGADAALAPCVYALLANTGATTRRHCSSSVCSSEIGSDSDRMAEHMWPPPHASSPHHDLERGDDDEFTSLADVGLCADSLSSDSSVSDRSTASDELVRALANAVIERWLASSVSKTMQCHSVHSTHRTCAPRIGVWPGTHSETQHALTEAVSTFRSEAYKRYGLFFRSVLTSIRGLIRVAPKDTVGLGYRSNETIAAYVARPDTCHHRFMLEYLRERGTHIMGVLNRMFQECSVATQHANVLRTVLRRELVKMYDRFARSPSSEVSDAQRVINDCVARTGLYSKHNRVRLTKIDQRLDVLSNFRALMAVVYDCVFDCAVPTLLDFVNLCALDASRNDFDLHLNVMLIGPGAQHKSFVLDLVKALRIGGDRETGHSTTVEITRETDRCHSVDTGAQLNGTVRIYHEAPVKQFLSTDEDGTGSAALKALLDHCISRVAAFTYVKHMREKHGAASSGADAGAGSDSSDATLEEVDSEMQQRFRNMQLIGVHLYALNASVAGMHSSMRGRILVVHTMDEKRHELDTQTRMAHAHAAPVVKGMSRECWMRLHHFIQAVKAELDNLIFIGAVHDVGMDLFASVYMYLKQYFDDRGMDFLNARMFKMLSKMVRTLCMQEVIVREFCYPGGMFVDLDVTTDRLAQLEPFLVTRMPHVTVGLGLMIQRFFPPQIGIVRRVFQNMFLARLRANAPSCSLYRTRVAVLSREQLLERGVFLLPKRKSADERKRSKLKQAVQCTGSPYSWTVGTTGNTSADAPTLAWHGRFYNLSFTRRDLMALSRRMRALDPQQRLMLELEEIERGAHKQDRMGCSYRGDLASSVVTNNTSPTSKETSSAETYGDSSIVSLFAKNGCSLRGLAQTIADEVMASPDIDVVLDYRSIEYVLSLLGETVIRARKYSDTPHFTPVAFCRARHVESSAVDVTLPSVSRGNVGKLGIPGEPELLDAIHKTAVQIDAYMEDVDALFVDTLARKVAILEVWHAMAQQVARKQRVEILCNISLSFEILADVAPFFSTEDDRNIDAVTLMESGRLTIVDPVVVVSQFNLYVRRVVDRVNAWQQSKFNRCRTTTRVKPVAPTVLMVTDGMCLSPDDFSTASDIATFLKARASALARDVSRSMQNAFGANLPPLSFIDDPMRTTRTRARVIVPKAIGDPGYDPNDDALFFDQKVLSVRGGNCIEIPTHWLLDEAYGDVACLVTDALDELAKRQFQNPVCCTFTPHRSQPCRL